MKQNINEIKRMQRIAGLITETEYRESLINEASEDEVPNEASEDEVPLTPKVKKFIDKSIADAKKDGEFDNLLDSDWFDNELIDELIDLFPDEDYDSASKIGRAHV